MVAVRRLVRTLDKGDDPAWIAKSVEVCFEEVALRWHVSLEDEIKRDWGQLEKALLDRFTAPETRESRYLIK